MSGTVRHARITDIGTITEIYNEAVLHSTATFDTEPKTVEERKVWLDHRSHRYPVLVCEDHGMVLGWGALNKWSDKLGYADTVENSVYVAPGARGKGVGRAILQGLINDARKHGIHTLIARITDNNEVSIKMHTAQGFVLVGTLKEAGKKFGRLIDVQLYQLIL